MNLRKAAAVAAAVAVSLTSIPVSTLLASAEPATSGKGITINQEKLDRGLAAIKISNGVYLSWRLYTEEDSVFGTAKSNVSFNIYRDGELIANEADTTNYIDVNGALTSKYAVEPVIGGVKGEKCAEVTPYSGGGNYFEIPLVKPEKETINYIDGEGKAKTARYSFSPADCSCGDLDGDGEYEIIVKWTSHECDVGNAAYSGTVRFAAYKMDGTKLWDKDINLGKNVFSSAHTAQFLVYDFDGDGKAEMTVQTAPGSKDAKGNYVSQVSRDTSINAYNIEEIEGSELTVNMKNTTPVIYAVKYGADGALEKVKQFKGKVDYKSGKNVLDAGFDIDKAFIWNDMEPADGVDEEAEAADYREVSNGRIASGPEYLTVFNGETGEAIDTINYPTKRISAASFGKNDGGNRCQRFLASVGYIDGVKPYAVYWRGYYDRGSGRTGIAGVSFDGERLSVDYQFDTQSSQPGYAANTKALYTGQGNHSMICVDVDGDGMDEIISGALCMEASDDLINTGKAKQLKVKWCTFREHGDAHHIADYDPTNEGLEYFTVQEHGGGDVKTDTGETLTLDFGMTVVSARDGKELFHTGDNDDTGRGMMANVGAGGYYQITGAGTYICNGGTDFEAANLGMSNNFRIFWDGDLYDELLDGTEITSWNGSTMERIFNADGCTKINGTKSNPCLQADLFGDWREEVIYPTTDGNSLRVYTTNIKTDYKMKSLMFDGLYRNGVAAEQTTYNQPPHISYYLSEDSFYGEMTGIDVENTKATYYAGEEFDKSALTVTVHYSEHEDRIVSNYSISGYNPLTAGEQELTVKYLGCEKKVAVTVIGETGISVTPSKAEYEVGEELYKASLDVKLIYDDGTEKSVGGFKVKGFDSMKLGEQELTVTYTGEQDTYTKTVTVNVTSGLVIDENGAVTGYGGTDTDIAIPLYNGETPVVSIADGAFEAASGKIYIYSEDITFGGDNIFPADVTIVCYEGSTAAAYAAEHNIPVELMKKGDEVTFDEEFYDAYADKNLLMQSKEDLSIKDEFVTYNTIAGLDWAPWYKDNLYGFSVKSGTDGRYLSVNAGIYDDWNKYNQVYITFNTQKNIDQTQTISFDIMFPKEGDMQYAELQNEVGTVIDTISPDGLSNDTWYRYEMTFDGTYSRTITDMNGETVKETQTLTVENGTKILAAVVFKQRYNWGSTPSGTVCIDNMLIN